MNRDSGPLYENVVKRLGRTDDEVCGGCKMFGTKPGRYSPHLTHALALAAHLDELREAGASFSYPSALPPFWWTCLKASKKGRQRAEEARNKRLEDKRKREQEAEQTRREALERSGGRRRLRSQ